MAEGSLFWRVGVTTEEDALTSSFCSAPRNEKLQFQRRKCQYGQTHLRKRDDVKMLSVID